MTSYTPKEYSLPMSATLMEFYLPFSCYCFTGRGEAGLTERVS